MTKRGMANHSPYNIIYVGLLLDSYKFHIKDEC